jgi:hypothetical protein
MMTRNWKYTIGLLGVMLLLTAACNRTKNSPLRADYSNFKLQDTAAIDSIFIEDKGGRFVRLVREEKGWRVNNDFRARPDLIQLMLNTLHRMEVKEFVRKSAIENMLRQLAVFSTQVKVFEKGVLLRNFHVGGPTMDHLGTYMLMSETDVPVVVYVPGFRGYLSNHFSPLVEEWRDRKVFNYSLDEIKSVTVEHHREPVSSFTVEVTGPGDFRVTQLNSGVILTELDTGLVKIFLKNFKLLGFEGFTSPSQERLDSVKAHYALYSITVQETGGKSKRLDLYELPLPPGTLNMVGEPVRVDVDRMLGIMEDTVVTMCQYFTYDPVTVPIRWFVPGMAVTVDPGRSGSRFHE